ncbi:nitrous oxide reductase family maturation protein NosD [uncultured Methanobrevibacter sp.]|uniref:right-handed parallel beta-helix repeat-containing protein n=1 Tax=uncultured Methanobrevibacter sp. TaxID=253161 RepID=UPI0025CCD6BB|nr:right-handed parallel beta-helix repeat-containing protein [uncultured Methanobrevibacter sp.]
MNKKAFILVLFVLVIFSLNFCAAQEVNNVTDVDSTIMSSEMDNSIAPSDQTALKSSSPIKTQIDVKSNTTFDVVGDYFKIKLSDENGVALKNTQVKFGLDGKTFTKTTNSNGIASLQLNLKDGTYKISTKFLGNSNFKSSSKTVTITMSNTRIVDAGLSNSEIQKIIDNAKDKNIILFKGNTYSDINLVINKRLTLISNSNTVLKSSSANPVITIKGKNSSLTTIKGFKIRGSGDGIKIVDSDYVTVVSNDISTNGNKSGIVIANAISTYIFNNKINDNGINGIELAKSDKAYIHGNSILNNAQNGILTSNSVNGVNYGSGPENLYISKNTINNNKINGIYIKKAGDNINIKGNVILRNSGNGISITDIGSNVIQSNEIAYSIVGIKFNDEYLKPKNQDISYNVIHHSSHVAVEARDTYYYDYGEPLVIGDNWFTDDKLLCPKVRSNNMKFVVSQVGPNTFQATFYDSKGNIASLLPDRTLTYEIGGQKYTMTLSGGTGVFKVDAANGDLVKATVDSSHRDNTYNEDIKSSSNPTNGVSPSYDYPDIPYAPDEGMEGDFESGSGGNGYGNGNGGNANSGSGQSSQAGDNVGNSTNGQRSEPTAGANNPVNDAANTYDAQDVSSQASSSEGNLGGSGSAGSQKQSVVKQIIFDEDEFYKVSGILFIVLLIICTVIFYYRKDISEMMSEM